MEQWKPIITDDDLPPIGQKVLVTTQKGEIEIAYYGGEGVKTWYQYGVEHNDPIPKWWYAMGALSDEHPLAWMPLPERYFAKTN